MYHTREEICGNKVGPVQGVVMRKQVLLEEHSLPTNSQIEQSKRCDKNRNKSNS